MGDENTTDQTLIDNPSSTSDLNDNTTNADTDTGGQADDLISSSTGAIVNPDGTFSESWREALPEDLRDEDCWNTVTDFKNMAKQFVNQRKAIGKNKIPVPSEKSSQDEWDAFYDAIGRPKTPDDYKVEVPEELGELFDEDHLKQAKDMAHKMGITDSQFKAYMQFEMDRAQQLLQEEAEMAKRARDEGESTLRREFGQAYHDRMASAKQLINDAITDPERRQEFLGKFGNDVDFIRFASTIGNRLSESSAQIAELRQDTPNEALKKIKELQNTPGYMSTDREAMNQEQRQAITHEINELYKVAYPEQSGPTRLL